MGDVCGSLALARAFRSSGSDVLFLLGGDPEALTLVQQAGCPVLPIDAPEKEGPGEMALIREYGPDVIVVNRLNNPPGYLCNLKALGGLVVVLDDNGPEAHVADLNINVLYHTDTAICDPEYIALREEFQFYHNQERVTPEVASSILVLQGGSDTYGFIPAIVAALRKMAGDFSIAVVTGWAFRHFTELNAALNGDQRFRVIHGATNMAELMVGSDLAITAGGNTMFELACVGTPGIVVCAEEFEVETAERFAMEGIVVNLGFGGRLDPIALVRVVQDLISSPETRRRMSIRGKELVDGQGAVRVAKLVLEKLATKELTG
ncbi:MAG: hypothetical protein M1358_23605 [Chloroflexi bacterium]|nr:hypothetical protein [Chloroflexota bacterium]